MDLPSQFPVPSFFVSHKRVLAIFFLLFVIIAISITLFMLNQQQDIRQHAAGSAPMTCGNTPTDTVIILDKSPSMNDDNKLALAKQAAKTFIDQISQDPRNKVALVTFGYKASVDSQFTNNYSSVKSKIDSITTLSATCIQCGIKAANTLISGASGDGQKKVAILLTDGQPNAVYNAGGFQLLVSEKAAADAATQELANGYSTNKAPYYTIGLGADVNSDLLKSMAGTTGGEYDFSPTANQLSDIYTHISQLIGKGGISGTVYEYPAQSETGVTPDNLSPLGNWGLTLTSAQSDGSSSATTSGPTNGAYSFGGLCDGTYTLSAASSPGWMQILPTNPESYTMTISNGNMITDKNFGFTQAQPTKAPPACGASCKTNADCAGAANECGTCMFPSSSSKNDSDVVGTCQAPPTPTATPIPTKQPTTTPTITPLPAGVNLTLNVTMPGIGSGNGDNSSPEHMSRTGAVAIFNASNQQVGTNSANFAYTNGVYTSHVQTSLQPGLYYVKVKLDNTLFKLIPGVQNLRSGENNLTTVALVPGDLNGNNILDISDYNVFVGCYGTSICSQKNLVDFNDDGVIDTIDYNILLRSFATRLGD